MLESLKAEGFKCCFRFRQLMVTPIFTWAVGAASFSGSLGIVLRVIDTDLEHDFLREYNPDTVVFNVFVVFASLVATFRTSHALVRYTEAAAMMHRLSACWADAASTLVAFCRGSGSSDEEIRHFQETLVRLISLLNAMCLDGLEQKETDFESGHNFQVLGWKDLGADVKDGLAGSSCKQEYAFQSVQQLIVDAINTKILCMAPPLLTRSIQELGAGMLTYHEAKKLSCVPLPFAYLFITRVILVCEAVFLPFILAVHTQGTFSCFWYSFGGTVLLWFLNGVAGSLDNPFKKEASSLDTGHVQLKLNEQLRELVRNANTPTPCLSEQWQQQQRRGRESAHAEALEAVQYAIGGDNKLGSRSNIDLDALQEMVAAQRAERARSPRITRGGQGDRGERRLDREASANSSRGSDSESDRSPRRHRQRPAGAAGLVPAAGTKRSWGLGVFTGLGSREEKARPQSPREESGEGGVGGPGERGSLSVNHANVDRSLVLV